jgi:hypothetical protein
MLRAILSAIVCAAGEDCRAKDAFGVGDLQLDRHETARGNTRYSNRTGIGVIGALSWTPKMRQVDKVEPCP